MPTDYATFLTRKSQTGGDHGFDPVYMPDCRNSLVLAEPAERSVRQKKRAERVLVTPAGPDHNATLVQRAHVMADSQSTVAYRDVPDFPGYRVGDDGSVWCNLSRNGKGPGGGAWRRLRPRSMPRGYLSVTLRKNGSGVRFLVHRLVLTAFVGPCPDGMEACHFPDRDPSNCRLANLRWATHAANMADKIDHGTDTRGDNHPLAKLTSGQVLEIRSLYGSGLYSHGDLAKRFGVDRETIGSITRRESWRHL